MLHIQKSTSLSSYENSNFHLVAGNDLFSWPSHRGHQRAPREVPGQGLGKLFHRDHLRIDDWTDCSHFAAVRPQMGLVESFNTPGNRDKSRGRNVRTEKWPLGSRTQWWGFLRILRL